jgi:hypothetical protein
MSIEQFLKSLGVDCEEFWPADTVGSLRAKCQRLTEHVQDLHRQLVRCQRSMLALRSRTERACSLGEHLQALLERKERRYQQYLARLTHAKRKLASLRQRLSRALANARSFAR